MSRDPAHCIDRLSKDLAKTEIVSKILQEAKEVYNFVHRDRMDSIRKDAILEGRLPRDITVKCHAETRMNHIHDHILSASRQRFFLATITLNYNFKRYYDERSKKDRDDIDAILGRCNNGRWLRMETFCKLSAHFLRVHKLCSRHDFPLSCYILLVQGMRNGINKTITEENCAFDHVLGSGLEKEIADMIRCCFNMDGSDPEGRKVGLLDKHHIWCFLCDPFN